MTRDLTLLFGPQSKGAMTLNDYVRRFTRPLAQHGMRAVPTRFASPLLRRCQNSELPIEDRKAEFDKATAQQPVFLAGVNVFGPAEAMLGEREFLPDVMPGIRQLGEIVGVCQVVMVIDPLPHLFSAPVTQRLAARVRPIGWEALFEMGWVEVFSAISDAMPKADILVLTSKGMAVRTEEVLIRLFGNHGPPVEDPYWLLRQAVSDTGHAVLDRFLQDGSMTPETINDFYSSFAVKPDPKDIEARLGIEKITTTLMEQRFEEDLAAIEKLPRTEII